MHFSNIKTQEITNVMTVVIIVGLVEVPRQKLLVPISRIPVEGYGNSISWSRKLHTRSAPPPPNLHHHLFLSCQTLA